MKSVELRPGNVSVSIPTRENVLNALLSQEVNVLMACRGKGLCATCHVRIEEGHELLTPRTDREERTLSVISRCDSTSRLACQARVLGDGVVVRLPDGMYIEHTDDLSNMVGKRAKRNVLHPINGEILVSQGKIITKSRVEELRYLNDEVQKLQAED